MGVRMEKKGGLFWLRYLAVAGSLVACRPPAVLGQTSACVTGDRADAVIATLRRAYGYPANAALAVVSQAKTCQSAVKAFNAVSGLTNKPGAVTQAVVVSVADTEYVVMSPQEQTSGEWRSLMWFTKRWALKRELPG